MALYSFFVLPESKLTISGGAILDGVNQGTGVHLVGETITIDNRKAQEVFIDDSGTETNFADNDRGQTLASDTTIDGVDFTAGTRVEAEFELTLRDPNTLIEYTVLAFNIGESSPAYGTIEALAFVDTVPPKDVALEVISASEGPSNGGPNAIDESRIVQICFAGGTAITTDQGPKSVEALKDGDQILRADGTFATLRRVFRSRVSPTELLDNPKHRPIRIVAGALGGGKPERDLLVSRQHRMQVSSKIVERMFGVPDILVPAIKLTKLPGIFEDTEIPEVEYFHLLFDCHEVIFAEGAPTESLFTGQEALKAVGAEEREEILSLFPELRDPDHISVPARPIPLRKEQKRLIARHARNAKPLLETFGG